MKGVNSKNRDVGSKIELIKMKNLKNNQIVNYSEKLIFIRPAGPTWIKTINDKFKSLN